MDDIHNMNLLDNKDVDAVSKDNFLQITEYQHSLNILIIYSIFLSCNNKFI